MLARLYRVSQRGFGMCLLELINKVVRGFNWHLDNYVVSELDPCFSHFTSRWDLLVNLPCHERSSRQERS